MTKDPAVKVEVFPIKGTMAADGVLVDAVKGKRILKLWK